MIQYAVTDSACLIALERIERLELLPASFEEVLAPPEVLKEFGKVPTWIEVRGAAEREVVARLRHEYLGEGESAAIALATEIPGAAVILDERKARRVALKLDLIVMGTLGVLVRAKELGVIRTVRPLVDELRRVGFYLTEDLLREVFRRAEEH
ncbi:MAG: DUF3368 domain-containing protein [Candidatus Hydrogenedentes bacterium]|nr:DUF3368 domain-containing protein [Candidatus Hydrogenedentota bacterium]